MLRILYTKKQWEDYWDTKNIYCNPEAFNLQLIGEVEYLGGYEFDKIVVWKGRQDDSFYYAQDAGCSCPTPFDATEYLEELVSLEELKNILEDHNKGWRYVENDDPITLSIVNLLEKAREAGLR